MTEFKHVSNPEEIAYARVVANTGKDQSHEGKFYYAVSSVKLTTDLPGRMVKIGCVVETEKGRDIKQGADQDFGVIKIMFYALFSEKQVEVLSKLHPEISLIKFENHNGAHFLTWEEYKHLKKIK